MTNLNTKPEAAPASDRVNPAVAPAPDTATKIAPQAGEHENPVVEPPKS